MLTAERARSNEYPLTQEFLAQMLGVRRAGVTVAAGTLQKAGIIRYSRGKVTIVDHERLEEAACECYEIIRKLQRSDEIDATATRALTPAIGRLAII